MNYSDLDLLNQQHERSTHARAFLEVVKGVGLAGMRTGLPLDHLRERLGDGHAFVVQAEKTAISAMTTTGDPSLALARLGRPFVDTFRSTTVAGQLRGTLSVPPNTLAPFASGGTPATWVAEGAAIPVTSFLVDVAAVPAGKIAVIGVFSQELLRLADDRATSVLERHLQYLVRRGENAALLGNDPAIAGESSAGLLFGLSPVASGSPTSLTEDLLLLWAAVRDGDPVRPHFVLAPHVAVWLAAQRSGEGPMFPGISAATGGSLFGAPVILAPEALSKIILVDASALAIADDGLSVDASHTGALQMRDDPVAGATALVGLWQNDATAIRMVRCLSWVKAVSDAVAYLSVDLPAAGSPS